MVLNTFVYLYRVRLATRAGGSDRRSSRSNVNAHLLEKCAGLPLTYSAQKIKPANVAAFGSFELTFLKISRIVAEL
jgi:hypothetical protein